MSTNQGINITKYMLGNTTSKLLNIKSSTGSILPNIGAVTSSVTERSSIARIISYFLAIIIVLLVILLFINYFITPIFKLQPGAPGIIPVPGFDDGVLFWNTASSGQILNKNLPISSQSYNYTINLDVFIENPLQFSIAPRIFFSRGGFRKQSTSGDTILSVMEYYNLVAALLPDTNDLIVSVLNTNNNMENIVISNIQVQEPFRLTIVVMEQAMEVYINGRLMKTRAFSAVPKDITGDIYPATGIEANAIKVRNLKIWSRILSVGEIQQATPSLSSESSFGAGPMPASSTCAINKSQNMTNRLSKLSVNSLPDDSFKLL